MQSSKKLSHSFLSSPFKRPNPWLSDRYNPTPDDYCDIFLLSDGLSVQSLTPICQKVSILFLRYTLMYV